ncbi:Cof-type HAD-IIB family hydrolase [Streptococcus moroccensis]|uniref:Cof subfamily protein (Haloacid dehalogenase superfamily) n=1 Tax=Streptococcus moroccensis TaxID=1451356 RepID=A0ABT9YUE9_9STRE|nr:Cof-type HAD-IIB family hydrolase [Streptococcus moroccensis]MDQ0223222.1 Cof subfamily protein (haloacid dehalogenase superfamily) [Streptococcus moroccensis]
MIQLIATDMDGTFLDHEGSYDKVRFRRILNQLAKKNIQFAVASGRSYLALERLFAEFKDEIIFIAENGSLVMEKDVCHFEAVMTPELYLSIISRLGDSPFPCEAFLLSGRKAGYVLDTVSSNYLTFITRYYENVVQVSDFSEIDDDIFKITANFSEDQVLDVANWLTQEIPGVTAMTTGFQSIDIIREDIDKETGLASLCQYFDLSPVHVLAFGDNLNDYRMLQFAGTAIATANAREEVKQIADLVIGSCEAGAVQTYIEENL